MPAREDLLVYHGVTARGWWWGGCRGVPLRWGRPPPMRAVRLKELLGAAACRCEGVLAMALLHCTCVMLAHVATPLPRSIICGAAWPARQSCVSKRLALRLTTDDCLRCVAACPAVFCIWLTWWRFLVLPALTAVV